jgi:hypothetical protein
MPRQRYLQVNGILRLRELGVFCFIERIVPQIDKDEFEMEDTDYMVKLDPCYDREFVWREIEAAILTA